MLGGGFHRLTAMVLESVTTLSPDGEPAREEPGSSKDKASKPKPEAKAKSKGKAKAKAKSTEDPPMEEEQGKDEETPADDAPKGKVTTPMKKPAASTSAKKATPKKRPAAAMKTPKKVKVGAYKYKDTNTFGYKVNGKQVLTATWIARSSWKQYMFKLGSSCPMHML